MPPMPNKAKNHNQNKAVHFFRQLKPINWRARLEQDNDPEG
jgi:hypothetical protein